VICQIVGAEKYDSDGPIGRAVANTQSIGVLIVDDQADVRRALCALLRMLPDCFLAAEANSGREALELATRSSRNSSASISLQP